MVSQQTNWVGQEIGKVVLTEQLPSDPYGRKRWAYLCDCEGLGQTHSAALKRKGDAMACKPCMRAAATRPAVSGLTGEC